jgi:hypothetical protein
MKAMAIEQYFFCLVLNLMFQKNFFLKKSDQQILIVDKDKSVQSSLSLSVERKDSLICL